MCWFNGGGPPSVHPVRRDHVAGMRKLAEPGGCSAWKLTEETIPLMQSEGREARSLARFVDCSAISGTVYNQWSHCTDLPVNETFQVIMRKDGLEIRYLDQHQKIREQLYKIEPVP